FAATAAAASAAAARPGAASHVAGQISAAMRQVGDATQITLQLDPVELGRVSIELDFQDDGLVVSVRAERPEALDLMRRSGAELEQALRDAGIDFQSMSFSGESSGRGLAGDAETPWRESVISAAALDLEAETIAPLQPTAPFAAPGADGWAAGVDLRV
ncbi:MAG: flagellar hook-length control protein FliK, partial [Pseudomonadota bacterium]